MKDDVSKGIFAVATAIVGVAIIAVLVAKNSQTTSVIQSISSAFTSALQTAVSPITGN